MHKIVYIELSLYFIITFQDFESDQKEGREIFRCKFFLIYVQEVIRSKQIENTSHHLWCTHAIRLLRSMHLTIEYVEIYIRIQIMNSTKFDTSPINSSKYNTARANFVGFISG